MKIISALMLMAGLMAVSLPAIAEDGANFPDMLGDVITGHQDNCPTVLSIELCKELQTKDIPVINLIPFIKTGRTQIGIKGLTPMGERFAEEGEVEIPVRFIF